MVAAEIPFRLTDSAVVRRARRSGLMAGFWCAGAVMALAADAMPGLVDQPLAARSGPRGATLFAELPPDQTGLVTENNYADPEMWGRLYHEFTVGAIGTGVAVGDYDGDGRPDIFVVSKTESCRLFRNLGGWKFEDVTDLAGVRDAGDAARTWKQGATFADVNNDGRLDLYVCRFGAPNLLYLNQGNGAFKEEAAARGLAVSDASSMAAFCDYDRDGWLDVYLQTNLLNDKLHPDGQADHLFHNNRDGTFANVTTPAGISGESQGHSATWWDYDNDGWPDLYVANDFAVPDVLYHNNRDGTFSNVLDQVVPHTPFSSMGSDLGDVDNDGRIDLLVADMAATTHEKDQRTMADARGRTLDPPENSTVAPQYPHNALYLNTGTGVMREAAFLAGLSATDWTWSVRFEDLDNDGRLDLHVTNGMHRESHNIDVAARVMMAESVIERVRIERASPRLAEAHLAFRNRGGLDFENVAQAWGLGQRGVSFGAAFGDLDGDGDLDLVYTNYEKGVTLLRNDSTTGHRLIVALRGTRSNRFGVGATVRIESAAGSQVRQLVLARGYLSSSEPVLHFGLGDDTVIRHLTVAWPGGQTQSFENLAVDRKLTITEPPAEAPLPAEEKHPASGQFTEVSAALNLAVGSRELIVDETASQPLLPVRQNRRGPGVAIGDLDGDGRDDVVVGGTPNDAVRILSGSAPGPFTGAAATALVNDAILNDGPLLLFDAAGRGAMDLLQTKGGVGLPAGAPEYQPRLFFNDGQGGFQPAPTGALPSLPVSVGAAVAADFNHDGRLDVFLGARGLPGQYPAAPRSALLANRGGRFEDVTDALAPGLREAGLVTAALWTDVDGDGWSDLLVALEWGQVKYFHNDGGRGFDDRTEKAGFAAAGTGWWNSLAAADFNGDGRPDYVAGNLGLNTQYRASPEHPALLYRGEFADAGGPQLIEAWHEGDRLVPWRNRRQLGAVIPSLLKRYPRNDNFARATVGEMFGENRLAAAQRFAATEFRSGVFLSQPGGTYRFEPLPRVAQIAPMQGVVAGDFNGDGQADIYAVQNSYAPVPVVGRFDGGISQLLAGDGRGHFTAVPPGESNLIVRGDAKALAVLDFNQDGWPDFLVTRNNGTTLVFSNHGVAGRHSLRVRLAGPAGNETAVGARLTLELADGATQIAEVCAGSGYYSQSTAACFFGYPDANPPRRLRVRWPSGAVTEHDVPRQSTALNLSAPPP